MDLWTKGSLTVIRTLHFDHQGKRFTIEVDNYNDSESSDTVVIYGPGGEAVTDYDTCLTRDSDVIAEAKGQV